MGVFSLKIRDRVYELDELDIFTKLIKPKGFQVEVVVLSYA